MQSNQSKTNRITNHQLNSPPPQKKRRSDIMKDIGRDSLGEFQSSIFDASDGHKLVDFIRNKKGLRSQPLKIFDDVSTDRQSLQIEIQQLDKEKDDLEETLQPAEHHEPIPIEIESDAEQHTSAIENPNNTKLLRSPGYSGSNIKLKRSTQSIGRRTLLKEFEKTLHDSRFLPKTCSTPLNQDQTKQSTSSASVAFKNSSVLPSNSTHEKSLDQNMGCSPITISEGESISPNQASTADDNAGDVMQSLQQQNDRLLALADSFDGSSNIVTEKENSAPSCPHPKRIFTLNKADKSLTYIGMSNIISSLNAQSKLLVANHRRNTSVVSGSQKSVTASVQKVSRIPIIVKGGPSDAPRPSVKSPAITSRHVVENHETAQLIEHLQKGTPSNAPIIVIPVNQTFNQLPTSINSPNSNEITSTTTTTLPMSDLMELPAHNSSDELLPVNSLRLEDIITEDDDSSGADERPPIVHNRCRVRKERPTRLLANASSKQQRKRYVSSLTRHTPPPRKSSRHIREFLSPKELAQISLSGILDLRKRNSQGELRMTERDSNMFEKQLELELLKRNINENGYEDEVLQMEVLPAPPDNFSDTLRKSRLREEKSVQSDDLIDDSISSRISLSQTALNRLSKSTVGRKKGRKIMSEQLKNYLEASKQVSKSVSKSLNFSKRKLYNKGNSDQSSDDSSSLNSYCRTRTRQTSNSLRQDNDRVPAINNGSEKMQKQPTLSASLHSPSFLHPSPRPYNSPPRLGSHKQLRSSLPHRSPPPPSKAPPNNHSSRRSSTLQRRSSLPRRSPSSPSSPPPHNSPSQPSSRPQRRSSLPLSSSPPPSSPSPLSSPSRPSPQHRASTSQHTPNLPLSPPAEFANKSAKKTHLGLNDDVIFKVPHGRPPKKRVTKQKPRKSSHPVDPDGVSSASSTTDSVPAVRRSKRQKKPLVAYWSCSQTEFRPLFNMEEIYRKKEDAKIKRPAGSRLATKNVPSSKHNLVANTKTVESSSGEKPKKGKNLTKKQKREMESLQAKHSELNHTRDSSHCPSFHSLTSASDSQPAGIQVKQFASESKSSETLKGSSKQGIEKNSEVDKKRTGSKKTKTSNSERTSSRNSEHSTDSQATTSDDYQSKNVYLQESPENPTFAIELKKSSKANLKGPKAKRMPNSAAAHVNPTTDDRTRPSKFSEKNEANLKHNQVSSDCYDSSSDCPQGNYPSSVQTLRLATIAEDSTLELVPPSRAQSNKASLRKKTKKKDAFRTEHDESISDVSSSHVNSLFDKLKSASMCAGSNVLSHEESCSGQVSRSSQAKHPKVAVMPYCKNLEVRVMRMKNKKKSAQGSEQMCDSGFISEGMQSCGSNPKGGGDLLLNWLKDIVCKSPGNSEKGVARMLQSDGFHAASVDDLVFQELDGVDYAFYDTKERFSFGYMRFNPKTRKKMSRAKKFELTLFVLCGTLKITVNGSPFQCKSGDLITVFIGANYGIINISNDPALVMVIKK